MWHTREKSWERREIGERDRGWVGAEKYTREEERAGEKGNGSALCLPDQFHLS